MVLQQSDRNPTLYNSDHTAKRSFGVPGIIKVDIG